MKRKFEKFDVCVFDSHHPEGRRIAAGQHFGLDCQAISRYLKVPLTDRMVDLLRIASTVYFVDRIVKRNLSGKNNRWTRRITCSFRIRDLEFWQCQQVKELLERTVGFVSGDRWSFDFSAESKHNPCRQRLSLLDTPPLVCLYSGGLDSAAGLACRLSSGIDRPIIPVVIRHRNDIFKTASKQLKRLEDHFGVGLSPLSAIMLTMISPRQLGPEESSQRARSFLFLGVGGVVAWATNSEGVELYESGIGAINVPLLASMEGSQATRSCHPAFLRMMAELLSLAAERPLEVRLPFMDFTKGEIVQRLSKLGLQALAKATISCVKYPLRHKRGGGWKVCGVCPACIFRKLALHAGGIHESPDRYDIDLLAPTSNYVKPEQLDYLTAFLLLVDQLSELDEDHLPIVFDRHLRETDVLGNEISRQSCVNLYRRYRNEWLAFIEQARSNGCQWSNLIDLPAKVA